MNEHTVREMKAIYDGDIIWGEDGMEIFPGGPQAAKMPWRSAPPFAGPSLACPTTLEAAVRNAIP